MEEEGENQGNDSFRIRIAGHLTQDEVKLITEASKYYVLNERIHKLFEESKCLDLKKN
jgi:hypothetical protein